MVAANKIVVCDNGTGVRTVSMCLWLLEKGCCLIGVSPIPPCLMIDLGPAHTSTVFLSVCMCARVQFVKVGFAAENFPKCIFPSLVGRPILRAEEAVQKDILLKVRHTLERPSYTHSYDPWSESVLLCCAWSVCFP